LNSFSVFLLLTDEATMNYFGHKTNARALIEFRKEKWSQRVAFAADKTNEKLIKLYLLSREKKVRKKRFKSEQCFTRIVMAIGFYCIMHDDNSAVVCGSSRTQ
jgi:hypothetical protein